MKFYRVNHHTEGGNSQGFTWHTSRVEARREIARKNREEDDEIDYSNLDEPIDIKPTKSGILAALNYWAGHPDNG